MKKHRGRKPIWFNLSPSGDCYYFLDKGRILISDIYGYRLDVRNESGIRLLIQKLDGEELIAATGSKNIRPLMARLEYLGIHRQKPLSGFYTCPPRVRPL